MFLAVAREEERKVDTVDGGGRVCAIAKNVNSAGRERWMDRVEKRKRERSKSVVSYERKRHSSGVLVNERLRQLLGISFRYTWREERRNERIPIRDNLKSFERIISNRDSNRYDDRREESSLISSNIPLCWNFYNILHNSA